VGVGFAFTSGIEERSWGSVTLRMLRPRTGAHRRALRRAHGGGNAHHGPRTTMLRWLRTAVQQGDPPRRPWIVMGVWFRALSWGHGAPLNVERAAIYSQGRFAQRFG
jgi:hypothetical protein